MRRERILLVVLIVLAAALLVTHPAGLAYLGYRLVAGSGLVDTAVNTLKAENESLKAELSRIQAIQPQLVTSPKRIAVAEVYSRYPFGFKNELLVGKGASDGIAVDDVAAVSGVLIGKVVKVFQKTSLVQTVFDEKWQSAVRIGPVGIDALLVGGAEPKLTLIMKNAKLSAGDVILNAAPPFPLGLPIGELKELSLSRDGLFAEATMKVAYDVGRIRAVTLLAGETRKE